MGYTPITLPKSQEVVLIQPISPFLLQKLRRECPAPRPPMQQVDLGTPGNPHIEETPNESHPDYLAAKEAWAADLEQKMRKFTIKLGAKVEWNDDKKNRLQELRDGIAKANDEFGTQMEIEKDDDFAYISYIACQDTEDYKVLLKAIMEGSRPTEGAIQEAIATFRPVANGHGSDIQGTEHIRDMGSP